MSETVPGTQRREDRRLDCYLRTIARYAGLTGAEEAEALRGVRGGAREPLDRLIDANLRRVVSIAREYLGQGLGALDLIAEGTMGLIASARRFDESSPASFARCAEERIRGMIEQAIGELAAQRRVPAREGRA